MDAERTERLIGRSATRRIRAAKVLVMGLGGVGSWCAEALARAGVGTLGLLDADVVQPSNLNRQLGALTSTLGRPKAEVLRARVLDIHPEADVRAMTLLYSAETAEQLDLTAWDCVVDAIDVVSAKVLLAARCHAAGVRLYSAMGGGNKLDPERFTITDLAETNRCPLAKIMRKKLRKHRIEHLRVVASDEEPRLPLTHETGRHVAAGTLATVVGVEGLLLAHAVLRDLIGEPVAPLACTENPVLPETEIPRRDAAGDSPEPS